MYRNALKHHTLYSNKDAALNPCICCKIIWGACELSNMHQHLEWDLLGWLCM